MGKMIKVNFRNLETKEFEEGTSFLDVSNYFTKYFNYPILVARVDNNLKELGEALTRKCDIDFYDRSSIVGNGIYGRTLQFILIKAVLNVLGKNAEVVIEYSIDKGFYCEIKDFNVDKSVVKNIEKEMKNIVASDLIITKVSVSRKDAIAFFKKNKQLDKVNSLKYISNTYVNLYRLDDIYDYFYGEMAHNTKVIDDFKLTHIKGNGFVVSYPDVYNPECTLEYKHHSMLFNKFVEFNDWGKILGINNASDLNNYITDGSYGELIRLSETYYNNQLSKISEEIYSNKKNIKLVLIAGPSSSGKTTTSKKLEIYLRSKGIITHQLSMDNYFLNREDTPKDKDGEYDFESINSLDIDLFNKQVSKLLDGEKVNIPVFNFVTGKREYHDNYLQIGSNDIIIIEGIHGLNEDLTISVERKNKYKIYISPITQLNIDNHNRIHTSDTRKLRRIIRDNKYRGLSSTETLSRWRKIREGEEKYIFPYQDDADVIINSSLVYELGVLKIYAEPLLFSVEENNPLYPEAIRLINFLRNFLPIPSDEIPNDSVLREFIGGGCFDKHH